MNLNERDKQLLKDCIENNKQIPSQFRNKLFASDDVEFVEATKDYKLTYKGKARKEDIIANTPAAPLQKIRSFNSDNPFKDGWQNMLIFGDNLLALKTIYEDQRGPNQLKTRQKIKLICIDPPFATKQDFMKDREKAYRDKILGAQFIEFLRKRLILMREILADNGSIYVHLDWKKGHYIKAIMDEVFGEHNFLNHIAWCYETAGKSKTSYSRKHDYILFYRRNSEYFFDLTKSAIPRKRGKHMVVGFDDDGREYEEKIDKATGKIYRWYFDKGRLPLDYWLDISFLNREAKERTTYPTQKPEKLLERIISVSSQEDDIVLDTFAGSGTTLAVAEKLGRRWIGMDCGKLAIYTIQKRMLNLTTQIGPAKADGRRDYERVNDFEEHSKTSRGLFFLYEKTRRGDFVVTDVFLKNLAKLIEENLSGSSRENFSLICPEEKFKVEKLKVEDKEDDSAGDKIVRIGRVNFLISFINPKEKTEEERPLKAKEFSLYHAGIYDQELILDLEWGNYHSFVAQLFDVRLDKHKIYGFYADGYIGTCSAYIWPYPNFKDHVLDQEYVKGLHKTLGGRAGERFYVIAPVTAMAFMEDEITIGKTTYVFLKVPLSVLIALIEKGEPGSLKQPVSEDDVNEVIDAVGYDFISQPVVKASYECKKPLDQSLLNQKQKDYVIEISEFKSNTLVYDPDDFKNFETLSMVMVDCDYNDDYFNLSSVFWADKILDEEHKKAVIRIPQEEFIGKKMMIIFMDRYGNELKVVKTKKDFK